MASPINSTWFTRLFFLMRGWDLGMRLQGETSMLSSLVPRPPTFFALWFAFSIIHRSALPLLCIILNTNRRTKNGGGLGTRLHAEYVLVSYEGSVTKETSYTVGRNPIWNPEIQSEIWKSNLKMTQDTIKTLLKRITSLDLHRRARIMYDIIALTSVHNKWPLYPTDFWLDTKVIFWGDVCNVMHAYF